MDKDIFACPDTKSIIDCLMRKKNAASSDIASLCGVSLSKTKNILCRLCDTGLVEKTAASRGHAARYCVREDAKTALIDLRTEKPRLFLYSVLSGEYIESAVGAVGKRRVGYSSEETLGMMREFLNLKADCMNIVSAVVIKGDKKPVAPLMPEGIHTVMTTEQELIASLVASALELESFALVYDDGEKCLVIYSENAKVLCVLDAAFFKEKAPCRARHFADAAVFAAKAFHTDNVFISCSESDHGESEEAVRLCRNELEGRINVTSNEGGIYDIPKAAVAKSFGLI